MEEKLHRLSVHLRNNFIGPPSWPTMGRSGARIWALSGPMAWIPIRFRALSARKDGKDYIYTSIQSNSKVHYNISTLKRVLNTAMASITDATTAGAGEVGQSSPAAVEGHLSDNGAGRVLTTAEMEAVQKVSAAPESQPKARRNDFNKWVKGLFGFFAHNLFMLQFLNTEIGVSQKLYRLMRECCIFFHNPAVAMLYLKINGYAPLSSSSFYELHGLNENVDDDTYKQRFSSVVSSSRQSWRAIREIPDEVWLNNILPFLCGPNGFPTSIITDDKFNLKRGGNRLESPLAIFDFPLLAGKVLCLDTVTERLRSLSLPKEDSIPRNWNAGFEKSYENKKVTVASFFEKGVSALENSVRNRTPFVFMRGLMFFFLFSSLMGRAFPGLVVRNDLRQRFDTIARCYTGKQHVLYWVFLAQFLYRMITETASIPKAIEEQISADASDEEKTKQLLALLSDMTVGTSMEHTFAIYKKQASLGFGILKQTAMRQFDWAVKVDARLKGNINKTQKFDENKTKFGPQTRKEGMVVFIMAFDVFNHPARPYGRPTTIRFGIAMNKNDTSLEGVRGLTLMDVLKEWFRQFWEHPLSYYFQHSIPRPDEGTGLPTFSLTRRFSWHEYDNNGWMSSSRILHAMSLEYLDWDLQGSERSPKWYCAIEDLSEPEQCRLRIETNDNGSRYKSSERMEVSYEANLWDILNEKFPLIHANGLRFRFYTSTGSTFVLTPETTVTDYARYCHRHGDFSDLCGSCGLDVYVPSLSFVKVQNFQCFDNPYYARAGEYYKIEDYKLPLMAWLREKFPWLEKENVFHAVKYMNGDVKPTEQTSCIEFVKMCDDNEPLITLPNLQYVKVQNSRPFFEVKEGENPFDEEVERWPMNTLLKDIVNKIAARHPMLDANEVVLLPPMAITETATLLDWMVLNNDGGRVIKFKKVTVKLVERQPTELYSNIQDYVKQSATAMANLLKETLGDRITYRRLSKQDGKYTFKRDYIFVRQDADDLDVTPVVALLKLLYAFLYGKKTYEFRMGGQSFRKCFKRFQHTFTSTEATAEALNKDKFDALPDYFKARLLSSDIAKKFFGVVLLQQERWDCSDSFLSPFEFALRHVQYTTESCNKYFSGTWTERNASVEELIVSDDPNVMWSSSYKKCRPLQYLIVRKFSCFPNTLLPHNVLELWSEKDKKEILNAFFLCQTGDHASVGREEEGGLIMDIFGRGLTYENWPFANLCVSDKEVSEEYDQIRNYVPNVTFSYKNTKGGFNEIGMDKAISYYSKRYRYVGNGKFEENEKTDIICAARSPTVCKPWDMFYYLDKTGAYYKMENAYAEPEVWTEKLTEKQKATLSARAELNRKRAQPKKKRKRSTAGSSGSPSKRVSASRPASPNTSSTDIMNVFDTMISLTKSMVESFTGEEEELTKLKQQLASLEEKKRETLKNL